MTTMTSNQRFFAETQAPWSGLKASLTAILKNAFQDEQTQQVRTLEEEKQLQHELRMLGGC